MVRNGDRRALSLHFAQLELLLNQLGDATCARVIENLLPVMRELGLVTIFWDGNFFNVQSLFDANGSIKDPSYAVRIDKFLSELVWMAKVLRYGRESVALE